jgi:hypothetical protein
MKAVFSLGDSYYRRRIVTELDKNVTVHGYFLRPERAMQLCNNMPFCTALSGRRKQDFP